VKYLLALFSALALLHPATAQITAPNYEEFRLDAIFPAGGRQGETVVVEFLAANNGNLSDVRKVIIDGSPGITIRDVKNISARIVQATFVIAPDAVPGRRCVRVLNERSGLTNMLYFSVGRLPEIPEKEPNNEFSTAQDVTLPIVVNGRVDPKADVDMFRFELKKGQRIVAMVMAQCIDSHGQYKNYGYVDASLELIDERGRIVAEAGDTIGLDPQIEFTAANDGRFMLKVYLEQFEGFPQAVYRLMIGELSLPTSVFPPGGQRGTTVDVDFGGAKQKIVVPKDDRFPIQFVLPEGKNVADLELPFVRGDHPERLEIEPNAQLSQATPLTIPMIANARIDEPGDVDWYRVSLTAGQGIVLETIAQRYLRSPLDTRIEVYDGTGKKLAENDDGFAIDYISMHDYRLMDSRLSFTATTSGDYFVKVSDQSGNGGARAVYRLSITSMVPDFELFMYPDGVPIWGPGSTASLLVKVSRFDGLDGDVTLSVEGLPEGWIGSKTVAMGRSSPGIAYPLMYHLLTITAPPTAKPGQAFPFRVVGRADVKGQTIERIARPLTWYYSSDTGFFRSTPISRVVVTRPQTPWLSTSMEKVSTVVGGTFEVPLDVHGADKLEKLDLSADMVMHGVATALGIPQSIIIKDGKAVISVKMPESINPGRYGFVVALRWRSDIRIGMPGPSTRLITVEVKGK